MKLESMIMMFLGGAAYAGIALLRAMMSGERFEPAKLLKTAILSGLLASLNAVAGLGDSSEVEALISGAGETALLDKLLKAASQALRRLMAERWLG
ncbi:MAG: hypothetical protein QXG35_03445 [Nitrososphaerota archaeon]